MPAFVVLLFLLTWCISMFRDDRCTILAHLYKGLVGILQGSGLLVKAVSLISLI